MDKIIKYIDKAVKLQFKKPQWNYRLIRPSEISLFVEEHGMEYAMSFDKHICIELVADKQQKAYLFMNVFTHAFSFCSFGKGPRSDTLRDIMDEACMLFNTKE